MNTRKHVESRPEIGEEAVGEEEPSLLVALDVVGPLQQPALEMLRIGHLPSRSKCTPRTRVCARVGVP